jgi:hypothetical protein
VERAGATPLGDLTAEEFVLFVSYLSCGLALSISPFFLLLLEELGLQLQHLTFHSILQAAIFAHLCEMFVGVVPCTSLFHHLFVLVKSGKAKDHLRAYFQTRSNSAMAYIPTLGGARWENWHGDWVIASTETNDRLALPSDGPRLDQKQWRAKPSLAPEFQFVLDRIKSLAAGSLTSMHVVGDFLKHRITPLQERARLCCWFTGSNVNDRVQRGPGTDLSWEELEVLVKGITDESFVLESLILPQGIPALCDDPGLRTAILATLLTLDKSGVAVCQTGGRDPHRRIRISDAPAGGPQTTSAAPSAPAMAPSAPVAAPRPLDKGKGAAGSFSASGGTGGLEEERRCQLRCADGSFVSDPLEALEDCWWGRGGRLPSPGRVEARQSSATTTIGSAATTTTTTTTVGSAVATTTRGRSPPGAPTTAATTAAAATAAVAKAAVAPLPGSLEGPGPQVSGAPFFFISLFTMLTGLNPSFVCQGFLPLCSQGRSSSAPGCCRRDSTTGPLGSNWGSSSSGANVKRRRSGGGGSNCFDG